MGLIVVGVGMIRRAGDRDRELYERWSLGAGASGFHIHLWGTITRAGGAAATLAASIAPLLWGGVLRPAAERSLWILVVSHLVVQVVKRTVGRARPPGGMVRIADIPDRFSFPSGHAAAAMSVAIGYAGLHPLLAPPLVGAAMVVGLSRVMVGVHYPGDVAAGQVIAGLTALGLDGLT